MSARAMSAPLTPEQLEERLEKMRRTIIDMGPEGRRIAVETGFCAAPVMAAFEAAHC